VGGGGGGGGGGTRGKFSRLLAAELFGSAIVIVIMLDTPCSEVECKTTGYTLHSYVSPSLPLPCFTVCYQVSTELYRPSKASLDIYSFRKNSRALNACPLVTLKTTGHEKSV
jgi:hypothetical protein